MTNTKYKMYVVVHSHLSNSQKAVQAVHAASEYSLEMLKIIDDVGEMGRDRTPEIINLMDKYIKPYRQWLEKDRTVILLEGGNSKNLKSLYDLAYESSYATASFHEDWETLDGMMTSFAFLAPVQYAADGRDDLHSAISSLKLVK